MTPEERKAFGEKMKAARAAKKQEEKRENGVANETVEALLKRIEELEQRNFFQQPQPVVKAVTKWSIDPKDYPDPTERLANESRLEEHAFKQNFILKWEVGRVNYQHDSVNYTEPKFRLELWKWIRDEDTNEKTTKQFRVHKATFFEDPDAAIQLARDRGHEVDENAQKPFLDEMRYLRMLDWLLEIFYPQPIKNKESVREEVIGNRLVPVLETSSAEAKSIPREKLA